MDLEVNGWRLQIYDAGQKIQITRQDAKAFEYAGPGSFNKASIIYIGPLNED